MLEAFCHSVAAAYRKDAQIAAAKKAETRSVAFPIQIQACEELCRDALEYDI